MSKKPQVSPTLQSIKSMPVDFGFMGSPTSQSSEKSESNTGMIPIAIPEDGELAGEVVEDGKDVNNNIDQDNDESPYCRFNTSFEARPSVGEEDLDLTPSPLRLFVPSRTESNWSDTNAYAAKKSY
ncbi:hypothetical protein Acr_00g0080230 [Actinidia rufa]|uniref:Uncharacterized protein n=1 Tax=Actinidia rufa TaxID=165716 RepID=A0A7J0DWG4_9ERIC|nr:hypothetical protein Acr_00g0080230 [Actinidia rufa]